MATTESAQQPMLSFPRETFARLSPQSYLLAHLQPASQSSSLRANARAPSAHRPPHIHTGSLTHAHGSAVVRTGDTAVVCGVRGEILLASDAAGYRSSSANNANTHSEAQALDLLVPNVELATGCSPEFLPGMPPSKRAQELVSRVYGMLHASGVVASEELRIWGPKAAEEEDEEVGVEVKAFWTLYIDILFISLDGNAFDAAWAAVIAALKDVKLPAARWDADRAGVVCSNRLDEAKMLNLRGLPLSVGFAVFKAKESAANKGGKGKCWVLADPDAFEEELCDETLAVVLDSTAGKTKILGIEKVGGTTIGKQEMRDLIGQAETRWQQWNELLKR